MLELSKCTVLVVDDTEANIDILVAALDSEYEVSVVMDGESALQIVNTNPHYPHKDAVKLILENKGKHFDPDMVDAFIEIENTFKAIAQKFADFE